jgi:hypothetical protein
MSAAGSGVEALRPAQHRSTGRSIKPEVMPAVKHLAPKDGLDDVWREAGQRVCGAWPSRLPCVLSALWPARVWRHNPFCFPAIAASKLIPVIRVVRVLHLSAQAS